MRQVNASAQYALAASRLLGSFPGLQAAMVRAFVADKMSVTLTPAQFAAAKAKLLRGLPASFTHLLRGGGGGVRAHHGPRGGRVRAAILDTRSIEQALAHIAPRTLVLPSALVSSSVTAPEVRLAAALKGYADTILQPVPARRSAGGAAARAGARSARTRPETKLGETFHTRLAKASRGFGGGQDFRRRGGGGRRRSLRARRRGVRLRVRVSSPSRRPMRRVRRRRRWRRGGGEGGGSGDGAASYGEPHELTFSGAGYAFQAAGEFTLVKSTTDDLDIQVREQPFPGAGDVAARHGGGDARRQHCRRACRGHLGRPAALGRPPRRHLRQTRPGRRREDLGTGADSATVTWPDGTAVSVFSGNTIAIAHETVTCNSSEAINLTITVPPSRFGHLEGLLGDPGAPAGELAGGNGTAYSMDELAEPWESVHNFDVLYHQFAQSWRVSQQGSLFYYPKGTSTASFTDLAFPSRALTVASLTPTSVAAAERLCKVEGITNRDLLADCVYDVGLTGSRGACLAGADARVQAVTGGPDASGLPESSGTVPPSSTTTSPAPPPAGSGTPLAVGSGTGGPPALAVDASGTAYVVWQQSSTRLSFCKLANGPASCSPVTLEVAEPSQEDFLGTPSVLLAPGRIYVLDGVIGGGDDLEGIDEFVSTDGGTLLQPRASRGRRRRGRQLARRPGRRAARRRLRRRLRDRRVEPRLPSQLARRANRPVRGDDAALCDPQPAARERLHGRQPRRRVRFPARRLPWRARCVRSVPGQGLLTLPVERQGGPGLCLRPDQRLDHTGRALRRRRAARARGARSPRSTATAPTRPSAAARPASACSRPTRPRARSCSTATSRHPLASARR